MKSFKNYISLLILLTAMFSFMSCEDNNNEQEEDVFAGCCSDAPAFGPNVDNLDQSVGGEILVSDILTPNGDGLNEIFGVQNIENYPNHIVTIYNSEDQIVFESSNYVAFENVFPDVGFAQVNTVYPDGTYKYKIVIEDEQTFTKSGTFCLYSGNPPIAAEEQNFSECIDAGEFDPILSGF